MPSNSGDMRESLGGRAVGAFGARNPPLAGSYPNWPRNIEKRGLYGQSFRINRFARWSHRLACEASGRQ